MRFTVRFLCALAYLTFLFANAEGSPQPKRRAVLVGINDYSASRLGKTAPRPGIDRSWISLKGAVNDVRAMREILTLRYGFEPSAIVVLEDQNATRSAILQVIERHLVQGVAEGDVLLFYYSGHGSRVPNSHSTERDKLDESIVPADSRIGASDIRDKELRRLFNRALDRGARLTMIFDSCHSGSVARGLFTATQPRGLKSDSRDAADPTQSEPPEARGALVMSASQDFGKAWEIRDDRGTVRGAFSWALLRAMRSAATGEAAVDTFLRAQAILRADMPSQTPVLAGNDKARWTALLGTTVSRRPESPSIAVEKVVGNGTVVIQGGWAHGLTVGTELSSGGVRLKVTEMLGLGRSIARILPASTQQIKRSKEQSLRPGSLLRVAAWSAPHGRALRVFMPHSVNSSSSLVFAKALAANTAETRVQWVADPVEKTPSHVLCWTDNRWELLRSDGRSSDLGPNPSPQTVLSKLRANAALFMQIPASSAVIETIGIANQPNGIERVRTVEEADYVLVGRLLAGKLEFAWVRPGVERADARKTPLPLRTAWYSSASAEDIGLLLRNALLRLRKVHGWHQLESPPASASPYHLQIRQLTASKPRTFLVGDERYGLALTSRSRAVRPGLKSRFFYVFGMDSFGRSVLLFPLSSVENVFPLPGTVPPSEIVLGTFRASPPYGLDTYFLLSTDEALADPTILEFDGVRTRAPEAKTPLERLLAWSAGEIRAASPDPVPSNWSIEKLMIESIPPRHVPSPE